MRFEQTDPGDSERSSEFSRRCSDLRLVQPGVRRYLVFAFDWEGEVRRFRQRAMVVIVLNRMKMVAGWFARFLTKVYVGLTSRCSQQPPRYLFRMNVCIIRSVTPAAWASGAPSLLGPARVGHHSPVAVAEL